MTSCQIDCWNLSLILNDSVIVSLRSLFRLLRFGSVDTLRWTLEHRATLCRHSTQRRDPHFQHTKQAPLRIQSSQSSVKHLSSKPSSVLSQPSPALQSQSGTKRRNRRDRATKQIRRFAYISTAISPLYTPPLIA